MTINIPKYIGRFPVIKKLGHGGMGAVYHAKDPDIDRDVAIKVLTGVTDEVSKKRFLNEAKTIGRLSHPNIVLLLEYGFQGDEPYLVMEYLSGDSLDTWIKKYPVAESLETRRNIILQLCRAVNYSHQQDILHRDIKLQNIQILPDNSVKLLDFGIAQTENTHFTATGQFIGTPEFLAPEILNGQPHSTSTDCYSVNLIAYTLLTDTRPFNAKTLQELVTHKLTLIPSPPHKLNKAVSKALSKMVMSYLEMPANLRYQNLEPLEQAIIDPSTATLTSSFFTLNNDVTLIAQNTVVSASIRKKRRVNLWLGILLLLVIAGGMGILFVEQWNKKTEVVDSSPVITPKNELKQAASKKHLAKEEKEDKVAQLPVVPLMVASPTPTPPQPEKDKRPPQVTTVIPPPMMTLEKVPVKTPNIPADKIKKHPVQTKQVKKEDRQDADKKQPSKSEAMVAVKKMPVMTIKKTEPVALVQNPAPSNLDLDNNKSAVSVPIPPPPVKPPSVSRLPSLALLGDHPKIRAISSTSLRRGKQIDFQIVLDKSIPSIKFFFHHNNKKTQQVKIYQQDELSHNRFNLKLFVEPNAQLGTYILFGGTYDNVLTDPLIIRVTL